MARIATKQRALSDLKMASPQGIPPSQYQDKDKDKDNVRAFWDSEPCGTRYLDGPAIFDAQANVRYTLEPHIADFAQFHLARGLRVLEIGAGIGADYLEWLRAGANATGVDLSARSIERARERCLSAGFQADLRIGDAENLPFPNNTFDIVYSYGVLHHSPDMRRCIEEATRVLKPGGSLRIMIYHHPSLTGLMLWIRYGVLKGKSLRESVYDHLESPGTKTYTKAEAHELLGELEEVSLRQVFSPGDLLLIRPSARFQSLLYRWIWKLFPRSAVRAFGKNWGLFLLISGRKPSGIQG